jgi:hypothetical protein
MARAMEVGTMPKTLQIKIIGAGFEVTIGGQTDRFSHLGDAVAYAQERLGRVQQLRDLSARIE